MPHFETPAFILTRQWRDTPRGLELTFWAIADIGPLCITVTGQEAVLFMAVIDAPQLQSLPKTPKGLRLGEARFLTCHGIETLPVYCPQYQQARDLERQLKARSVGVWEADIRPTDRYLMERFIKGGVKVAGDCTQQGNVWHFHNPSLSPNNYRPTLKTLSLDIETDGNAEALYSIGLTTPNWQKVWMVRCPQNNGATAAPNLIWCATEKACLEQAFAAITEDDPDAIIGWHIVQFDCRVLDKLAKKHNLPFAIGRGQQAAFLREDSLNRRAYIDVPGRVILDGIDLLRTANLVHDSYKLEHVAKTLLGEGKTFHSSQQVAEITAAYHNDPHKLARYNLQDCQLVEAIFEKAGLLAYAIERSHLTGLALDKTGGSVAAFEFVYLPQLHRQGYIAPNLGENTSSLSSPGGYVLDSIPGIYRNILVLDFKSLYPSIIRTFLIDPVAFWIAEHQALPADEIVAGFHGAKFSRQHHLLPKIIEHLWQARDAAKASRNQPLSHAIKIIMNSFYGVLGSQGCRFFDPRIASSITLRGHDILQQTKQWIEEAGHQVIYGDTDSVFVWVGDGAASGDAWQTGEALASQLNLRWQQRLKDVFNIGCALEIEFETLYTQFVMPTILKSNTGRKKRYAGLRYDKGDTQLVFKGLENVRTDWTQLAKDFQFALYTAVFAGTDVAPLIRNTIEDIHSGKLDEALIYKKRLRRDLHDYTKNIPPHVKAAKRASELGFPLARGDTIEYVYTHAGPEPLTDSQTLAQLAPRINYQHYIDRQVQPIADGLIHFLGLRFDQLTDSQLNLFGD